MKKFLLFWLCMLICIGAIADQNPYYEIKILNTRLSDTKFISNIEILTAKNWKFAREPKISSVPTNFKVDFIKINDSNCKIAVTAEVDVSKNDTYPITIDLFLCSNICTAISKTIYLHFRSEQRVGETSKNEVIHEIESEQNGISYTIIIFAFLGGLILNFMPCVFPVLLLKIRLFSKNIIAMIGTICGIYVSFILYIAIIAILKISGELLGWGMHFQNIYFLKFTLIMFFLLTMLSFEICQLTPALELRNNGKGEFLKNFFYGVIASIMAMPCSAPFLGTATLYALRGTVGELIIIFLVVAIGFSLPYILAIFISRLTCLNKLFNISPIFKTVVNSSAIFGLFWILFLVSNHCSKIILVVYITILMISTVLFIRKKAKIALLLLCSIFLINSSPDSRKTRDNIWIVSEDINEIHKMISEAISDNRIVILSISADWCLTCKFNNKRLFTSPELQDIIKNKRILCIEGDISRKHEDIMKFILKYNRTGIPFIIVFGRKAKEGILLSELPSFEEITAAIKKSE